MPNFPIPFDPHFKGYVSGGPPFPGRFVADDYFLLHNTDAGQPEGWVYTASGTWNTKGLVGNSDGS